MMSGMLGTVAQGFAFGTGSAVAHRAVGAAANAMGGGAAEAPAPMEQAPPQVGLCDDYQQQFMFCMQNNGGDATACNDSFTALQSCQEQAKSF